MILQTILRNVNLQLPEGYELIVNSKTENVHLFYELARVSLVANIHGIKLIITLPLNTAQCHFTLYKIITLPERISSNKYVPYSIDYTFLIQHSNRDYLLLTEADFSQCYRCSSTTCPTNTVIYSARTQTCASSLYFQTTTSHQLCRRQLVLHHPAPSLQKYGTT